MKRENLDTYEKATQINRDPARYGTFAEIGAGQEVARIFFRVGGASNTVAKSMSAYDMVFSDAIYGPSDRYVSRKRLQTMLDHEYQLLMERLHDRRGSQTSFFAFAETVAARSARLQNDAQGWLGVMFQTRPMAQPSQIIIHVRMLDEKNILQQEALGIVGVNLLHAAFYLHEHPEEMIGALLDSLSPKRIEVDMIQFSGPAFVMVDNRLMSLQLVAQGLTDAAMFDARGEAVQVGEVLYQKPLLLERGSFRPVTLRHLDMLQYASMKFMTEPEVQGTPIALLMEMPLGDLLATDTTDHKDFLARADLLGALGLPVAITNYAHFHPLAGWLGRYTQKRIGIALDVFALAELFNEAHCAGLDGGILESFGRLFKNDLRLYIYPRRDTAGRLVTLASFDPPPHLKHLHRHLLEAGLLQPIDDFNEATAGIQDADVLAGVQKGDPSWRAWVPAKVAEIIQRRNYFGCRPSAG